MDYDEEAPLLRRGTVELLALAADIDADLDENGAVAVAVYDCADRFASGVRVDETTGAGDRFYLRGDVPDTTATETDARGIAGYFNMPPGPHTFTATRAMDATQVSAIEITVRAGHLHLAVMLMTPDGQLYEPPP
jgi:hypothetical protein